MFPSDLTLSALRFILSAKSGQSCEQDCETVDFCNSLYKAKATNIPLKDRLLFCVSLLFCYLCVTSEFGVRGTCPPFVK